MEKRRVRVYKPIFEQSVVLVSSIENGAFKFYTIVGKDLPIIKGTDLYVTGFVTTNKKGEKVFKVQEYEEIQPTTKDGIIRYLTGMKLPKLPKRKIKLIVDKYGANTLNVLNTDFDAITQIKGIPDDVSKAKDVWVQHFYLKTSEKFFENVNISENFKNKICKVYKEKLEEVMTTNTYDLLKIRGLDFSLVDILAKKNHKSFDEKMPERIRACILFILLYGKVCGHVFLDYEYIKYRFKNILKFDINLKPFINEMVDEGILGFNKLSNDKLAIYLKHDKDEEEAVCRKLYQMVSKPSKKNFDKEIKAIEEELQIKLADRQKEAITMALNNNVSIITGGPGRGKTTVINSIIKVMKKRNKDITVRLVAPTGKAARRMSEQTNLPASTIHSALQIHSTTYNDLFKYEAYGRDIEDNVVIVDECSMIGQSLFSMLLDSISSKTKLILVGDVDQIPSVQAGNVFKELIISRSISTCVLDTPFRQAEESNILVNAERINNGMLNLSHGKDFSFINIRDEEAILNKCLEIYLYEVRKRSLDDVWLLTPFRRYGQLGSNNINEKLRNYLNPDTGQGKIGNFRIGDKVMLLENLDGFSNGDTGYLKSIEPPNDDEPYERAIVDFGFGIRAFPKGELSKLSLAYASTIHKAQGCECSCIIMPEHKMFAKINKRNLVYTGVTRAKDKVYMIGQMDALKDAILDNTCVLRNTCIASRMRKLIPVPDYKQTEFNLNRYKKD